MARSEGHPRGAWIIAGARALLGQPFKPQGRGEGGQDCLGLVIAAARSGGIKIADHGNLPLRGLTIEEACEMLARAGCCGLAVPDGRPGDVILKVPAARQIHLAVLTDVGILEAHGGLRRVIERPIAAGESWHSAWRLPMGED